MELAKNGIKSSLIGLAGSAFSGAAKPSYASYPTSTVTTTTDDVPVFDRKKVSLALPGELFGQGFSIVTNISQIVGDVIMNSAQRKEKIFNAVKPIGKKILAFKGYGNEASDASAGVQVQAKASRSLFG